MNRAQRRSKEGKHIADLVELKRKSIMHASIVSSHSSPDYGIVQSSADRLRVLGSIVRRVQGADIHVLEIGSYEGSSALNFSQRIASMNKMGRVYCIDPWKPYLPSYDVEHNPTCAGMEQELKQGTVFERFLHNIQFASVGVPISYFKGTLFEMLEAMKNNGKSGILFDIIYIDGSHIYEDVQYDLELAWPLLRENGFMCGDDLELQLDEGNYATVRDNSHREYVDGYHPGVTFAVGRRFGKVWAQSGAWAVKKLNNSTWDINL